MANDRGLRFESNSNERATATSPTTRKQQRQAASPDTCPEAYVVGVRVAIRPLPMSE